VLLPIPFLRRHSSDLINLAIILSYLNHSVLCYYIFPCVACVILSIFFARLNHKIKNLIYQTENMDIDRLNFPFHLLNILDNIASADFIAIDFEFSGVASNNSKRSGRKIQSLQERYLEVKAAAEKYTILQVGLTTAHQVLSAEDNETDEQKFELRTYNIDLCPTIEDDLSLDRDFILQSGAAEFLHTANFNFDRPFSAGVRYLSRAEEVAARQVAKERTERTHFGDIQLQDEDTDALTFVAKVRSEVREWRDKHRRRVSDSTQLWILSRLVHWRHAPAVGAGERASPEHELTGFDKKLVHQLLRAEFPELTAAGRGSYMVISRADREKDKRVAEGRMKRANEQINVHVGFRWVVEALCGGSIRDISLKSLAVDEEGNRASFEFYDLSRRHADISKKLQSRRPVLVGHNAFGDLMYLYQKFLGDLPETVEEFGRMVGEMFPVVVDTKYMATHGFGSSTQSALDQIVTMLGNQTTPEICKCIFQVRWGKYLRMIDMNPSFDKYQKKEALHEAGYDSYLTARIMIQLSAKLHSEAIKTALTPCRSEAARKTWAEFCLPLHSGSMPSFEDEFWKEYGNRLRVFGTTETFMELNPERPTALVIRLANGQ
jgi:poly(A)-specific ribonuclease